DPRSRAGGALVRRGGVDERRREGARRGRRGARRVGHRRGADRRARAARAPELTLLASVALCQAIRDAGVAAAIKWPNDVLVGGRKVAGILLEMAAETDLLQWVVLGVGVNVNAAAEDFPPELRPIATSIAIERGE